MHAGDAVADRHDAADLGHVNVNRVAANLFADDFGNLVCFYVHESFSFILCS